MKGPASLCTAFAWALGMAAALCLAILLVQAIARRFPRSPFGGPYTLTHCPEPLVIVFPHRNREEYARYLAQELPRYLARSYPGRRVDVFGVQQVGESSGLYAKGVSWNVALRHLERLGYGPQQAVVLQDVDVVPREGCDYCAPPSGETVVWFLNAGGVRGRLGDFLAVNGYSNIERGWGHEDMAFWTRLMRNGGEVVVWPDRLRAEGRKAVVLNMEWDADTDEELHCRHYFADNAYVSVTMVTQGNPTHGVPKEERIVPPSRSGWLDDSVYDFNFKLGDAVAKLDAADYRSFLDSDGASCLDIESVREDDFFSKDSAVRNIVFDISKVLPPPSDFLRERFSWYLEGPLKCPPGGCPQGMGCSGAGVCIPADLL